MPSYVMSASKLDFYANLMYQYSLHSSTPFLAILLWWQWKCIYCMFILWSRYFNTIFCLSAPIFNDDPSYFKNNRTLIWFFEFPVTRYVKISLKYINYDYTNPGMYFFLEKFLNRIRYCECFKWCGRLLLKLQSKAW